MKLFKFNKTKSSETNNGTPTGAQSLLDAQAFAHQAKNYKKQLGQA